MCIVTYKNGHGDILPKAQFNPYLLGKLQFVL